MRTNLYSKVAALAMLLWGASLSSTYAQCTSCSIERDGTTTGQIDINGDNQTICITGNTSFGLQNVNGSGNKICIAPGVTWAPQSGSNYSNLTIDVYGTFDVADLAGNGSIIINVKSGGTLNYSGTNLPSQYTINNEGTFNLSANSTINFEGNLYSTTSTAVVRARGGDNSLLRFANNMVTNVGTMDVTHLENSHTKPFLNEGSVTIQGVLYQHGAIVNRGDIVTQCGVTSQGAGFPACSFIVGDKNMNDFSNEGGTFNVTGDVTIGGQVNMSGGDIIITGDITVNKLITGTGTLTVFEGEANVSTSGTVGNSSSGGCETGIVVHIATNAENGYDFHSNQSNENRNGSYCYSVSSTPLPVKLLDFNVKLVNQAVLLVWNTVTEINSKEFIVEKSTDLKEWITIGSVNAVGESVVKQGYSFEDQTKHAQINYYRLKIVDLDGSVEISPYRSINTVTKQESYIFPNPTSEVLYIAENDMQSIEKIFIYTASGQVVSVLANPTSHEINVSNLGVGNYLVRIIYADKKMKVYPFVIAK